VSCFLDQAVQITYYHILMDRTTQELLTQKYRYRIVIVSKLNTWYRLIPTWHGMCDIMGHWPGFSQQVKYTMSRTHGFLWNDLNEITIKENICHISLHTLTVYLSVFPDKQMKSRVREVPIGRHFHAYICLYYIARVIIFKGKLPT